VKTSFPLDEPVVFDLDVGIWSDVLGDVVFVGPEGHSGALEVAICGVDEVECLAHDEVWEGSF
jgi:hypothetical protein